MKSYKARRTIEGWVGSDWDAPKGGRKVFRASLDDFTKCFTRFVDGSIGESFVSRNKNKYRQPKVKITISVEVIP